jgi:hypothetical protein
LPACPHGVFANRKFAGVERPRRRVGGLGGVELLASFWLCRENKLQELLMLLEILKNSRHAGVVAKHVGESQLRKCGVGAAS